MTKLIQPFLRTFLIEYALKFNQFNIFEYNTIEKRELTRNNTYVLHLTETFKLVLYITMKCYLSIFQLIYTSIDFYPFN